MLIIFTVWNWYKNINLLYFVVDDKTITTKITIRKLVGKIYSIKEKRTEHYQCFMCASFLDY